MVERLKLKLSLKLLITFLSLTIVSITTIVITTLIVSSDTLEQKSLEQLTAICSEKKNQIEEYYKSRINNISVVSSSREVTSLYTSLAAYADSLKINDSEAFTYKTDEYSKIFNLHVNYLQKFCNAYGYDDLYLINDSGGQVVFSIKNKKVRGENLDYGKYKTSVLGSIVKDVRKSSQIVIKDFEAFEANENRPTQFIGSPVIVNEALVAVLVLQMSEKSIDKILNSKSTLGILSNSYVVGLNRERQSELRCNTSFGKIGEHFTNRLIDMALKKGDSDELKVKEESGETTLISYMPLNVKGISWAIFASIKRADILEPARRILQNNLFATLFILFFIIVAGLNLAKKITTPIVALKEKLLDLSLGILPKAEIEVKSKSEIGDIQTAFNKVVATLKDYLKFANKIGKNQLDAQFEPKSYKDALGTALIEMQKNLIESDKTAKLRKTEEEKQKWMTEGIARFGDILRQNTNSLEEQGDNIVINLVNFLNVNQGGLFVLNKDNKRDKYLQLISCFAYGRKKYLEKRINIGEGLVGACYIEKETIHLTNIPEDYPEITSGLGGSKPKAVLMVPLKMDVKILGVIELVSFNEFKDFEISFVEKIAENIASTIASAQINVQTARLLEESRMASEQMAAQEEEMRQNMEELQATQEESERKEIETSSIIEALNKDSMVVHLKTDGQIIFANKHFINNLYLNEEELIRSSYSKFCRDVENSEFIERIATREKIEQLAKIDTINGSKWIRQLFSPVFDGHEEMVKIIVIAHDITEQIENKNLIDQLKKEIEELKNK